MMHSSKTKALSNRRVYIEVEGERFSVPYEQLLRFKMSGTATRAEFDAQPVKSVPAGRKVNYLDKLPFGLTVSDFQWK